MSREISSVEQIVERWRESVATKKRSNISFDDVIKLKIESIKQWIWYDTEQVNDWEVRHFHYTNSCEKIWVDEKWR